MANHHEILGVSLKANIDEIHKAYRRLAKMYHPDSHSGMKSEDQFKKVKNSYEVLMKQGSQDSDYHDIALKSIERFEKLASYNKSIQKSAFGEPYSRNLQSEGSERIARVEEHSTPKKVLQFISKEFMAMRQKIQNTVTKQSDLKHRNLTKKLNRIPESEIGRCA